MRPEIQSLVMQFTRFVQLSKYAQYIIPLVLILCEVNMLIIYIHDGEGDFPCLRKTKWKYIKRAFVSKDAIIFRWVPLATMTILSIILFYDIALRFCFILIGNITLYKVLWTIRDAQILGYNEE